MDTHHMGGKLSVLILLLYGRTISFLLRMAIPPFIPFLMDRFAWSSFEAGILASAYLWTYALALIPWGLAIDRWGGKRILACGWLISIVSSCAFVMGSDLQQLVVARLVFGIGASSVLVASTVIVAEVFSQREMGRAMGVIESSSSVGTLLAGIAVPLLLSIGIQFVRLETWRTVFVVITIPAFVAFVSLKWIPGRSEKRRERTRALQEEALAGKRAMLRDSRLRLMSIGMVGSIAGITLVTTWVYAFLSLEYGMSLYLAGVVASLAIFLPAIPGSFLSGWLSDYFGTRMKVSAGGALLAASSIILLNLRPPSGILVLVLVFYGFFSLFHTPVFSTPTEMWSLEVSGTALSIIIASALFGAAIAPVVSGYLLAQAGNYYPVWTLSGAMYVLACIAFLRVREGIKAPSRVS